MSPYSRGVGSALALHGHFYQPPRENPWTEAVPQEPSAAPFHDWNSRITSECYRANGWAHVLDGSGALVAIVDNYRHLSFNIGPTLLSWLETYAPDVYRRILAADEANGRAIAQAYGHAILPLCNDRDLRTQIRWGLADFRHRFGREATGMWLPETAVDERVLAALAEEGVSFTILAPGQVDPLDVDDDSDDAGPDHVARRPAYRWQHPDRPDLGVDLVVYDGDLSHDVAFGSPSGEALIDRVVDLTSTSAANSVGADGDALVTVACDGETFGHHRPFADRAVAHALTIEAPARGVRVVGPAEWLATHPPKWSATVHVSSWSCAHGVGRWLEDCGCHTGGEEGWNQRWRAPLRAALDILRDSAGDIFERRGGALLEDPWAARDAYVDVLLGALTIEELAAAHLRSDVTEAILEDGGELGHDVVVEVLTLLEMQRHALLMYTSCGWFFNDLAGIETLQVLRYAARCMDLLEELGEQAPYDNFLGKLAEAVSNRPEEGDGRAIWNRHVAPSRIDAEQVAGKLARAGLSADLSDLGAITELAGFLVEHEVHEAAHHEDVRTYAGRVTLTHKRTRRRSTWVYGALRVGDAEPVVGVRAGSHPAEEELTVARLAEATRRGTSPAALKTLVRDTFPVR